MTREQKLDAIWRNTHSDFKGLADERWGDNEGKRTILVYRKGTCLVLLDDLTDEEIADLLPKVAA